MKVAFHTLGCKVNQYETEAIKEAFVSRGAEVVSEDEAADIYIVNTCTVTGIADRKSRQFIRRARKQSPGCVVVVTGCYAQVAPEEVASMPEADIVIGNSLKAGIADRAAALYMERLGKALNSGDPLKSEGRSVPRADMHVLPYKELNTFEDMGIVTSAESSMARAYIKIEEGCDRFCSYCLIPYARGKVRSRAPEEVVKEAQTLIEKGFREIVLTGINTALYGTEPGFSFVRGHGEEELSGLEVIIKRIDAIPGEFRIRLSSLEPTVVDAGDVKKLLGYEKLCHHLHLSIQSGSDHVLSLMNRHYTRNEYLRIVKALREFDPHYGVTTDIIVGFPGESEEDFDDTLDIVRQAGFGRVHVFRYSPRRGTPGAKMKDAIPGSIKKERAAALEKLSAETAEAFVRRQEGSIQRVLIEETEDGYATGYTGSYIKIYIRDTALKPGMFADVKITRAFREGALAEVCGESIK